MQGLVGTESLWRHGVESGLLRNHAPVGSRREDSSQQPGSHEPAGHSLAPGPQVQPLNSNKEEL